MKDLLITETPDFAEPTAEGRYHGKVVSCTCEGTEEGRLEVEIEALAGSTPGQEGTVKKLYFKNEQNHVKFWLRLAIVCGLTTQEELEAKKKAGEAASIEFEDCVGKQIMYEIISEKYKDRSDNEKISQKILPWNIWSVDDKHCENWPKDAPSLAEAGITANVPAAAVQEEKPLDI